MPNSLKDWARQHPAKVVGGTLAFILGTLLVWAISVEWFKTKFNEFVSSGTQIVGNHVEARTWFFIACSVTIIVAVGCAALAIQSEIRRRVTVGSGTPNLVLTTLNEVIAAAAVIRDRSFQQLNQPIHSLLCVRNTYYIHKDLTGEVRRYHEVRAPDKPIHFYTAEISVAAKAEPIECLDRLKLNIKDDGENEIVYLPTEMDSFRKKLLLVFLPRIEPGETQPRKVVVEYRWPGMWNQLKSDGQESFSWTLESRDLVPLLEFEIFWDPELGMALEWSSFGPQYTGAAITGAYDEKRRWHGCRYQIKNGPAGRSTYGLRLKVKRSGAPLPQTTD